MNNLKSLSLQVKTLAEEVRKHLGCGFDEVIFQNALAIEFRRHKIEYLKEVNIEIFYKGESVGVDRPDFIITRIGGFRKPVILEMKVSDKISDNHRMQLRSYCTSLPRNNNPVLKGFAGGMLLSFPSCDIDSCAATKIFVVDSRFRVLVDEQAEEDVKAKEEKGKGKKK